MAIPTPSEITCHTLAGPVDTPIYWTGPSLDLGALPAFFYFSLSGDESLTLDPFNQPVAFLADTPIRCFSLTLPAHGKGFDKLEAMKVWAQQMREGSPLIQECVHAASAQLTWLIEHNIVDPNAIAVGGLSRGAVVATHLAAQCPEIRSILLFAPLTSFSALREFQPIPEARALDLIHTADAICDRSIQILISNHDTRVDTDACYAFVRATIQAAANKRIRSPQISLTLSPPTGHKGHGTPPEIFYQGAQWIASQLLQEQS